MTENETKTEYYEGTPKLAITGFAGAQFAILLALITIEEPSLQLQVASYLIMLSLPLLVGAILTIRLEEEKQVIVPSRAIVWVANCGQFLAIMTLVVVAWHFSVIAAFALLTSGTVAMDVFFRIKTQQDKLIEAKVSPKLADEAA